MLKKTVFILQDTKESVDELTKKFNEDGEYEVIGSSTDGISALTPLAERKPDFLITGLVLLGYDGLRVIEKLRELNLKTKIIVLSALTREEVVSKAVSLGASYFLAKPYKFSILKERMKALEEQKSEKALPYVSGVRDMSLEEKISKIFINVGIPPHIKGYSFLREGVRLAVEDPEIINNITKKLYPMIGQKYQTTASKVERAIRHAIEVAWNRGRIESINNILGVRAYVGQDKPTNGEFIALVADKMLLEKV
ncbi:MAG: sporulation transcription factor Spo0A [Clostridia bacterium]|nr:sporulation transcription factor Spo0A [Clostridia bacterium]